MRCHTWQRFVQLVLWHNLPENNNKKKPPVTCPQRTSLTFFFGQHCYCIQKIKSVGKYCLFQSMFRTQAVAFFLSNRRLQVAYTHVHAYMWAPVQQGSRRFFCELYIPDVTISYVTRVLAECFVTHQSRCLEPEVKVAGSLVPGNGFRACWSAQIL